MIIVHTVADLRARLSELRRGGRVVGFVPTMGNLHAGHDSLLALARERADVSVASVFVNPTQFGPNEDYGAYPRTLDADAEILRARGCDVLFAPTVDEMYPGGTRDAFRIEVPRLSEILCGAVRPGHFSGVATVVATLFNMVQPELAVFGLKDYQQLLVIRRLVRDLAFPIEILGGPTVREASGLAMSSRNQYLSAEEKAHATTIYLTLQQMAREARAGVPREAIEREALARLEQAGFKPDYAALRRADDLEEPAAGTTSGLVALIAARLGRARLIDNLLI